MSSTTSRIPVSGHLLMFAVLVAALAFGALPSGAHAAACPGADACPWTQIDTFGGVGGGEFRAPLGVAADAGGNLYVVENDTHRVQKLDPTGGYVSGWGRFGSAEGEFKWPEDDGVATDGTNVYVADRGNKRIHKFGLDGSVVGSWTVGSPAQAPERVAVAAGKVYVSTSAGTLWRSNTAGVPDNSWDGDGVTGTSGSGAGQLDYPMAMAVDGSGVYVVDSSNERIDRFDASGKFVSAWGWGVLDGASTLQTCTSTCKRGIEGKGAGQFGDPFGIVVTGGKVWVTDAYNHRLQAFTPAGAHVATVGALPGGEFYFPMDVTVAPSGAVFVADYSAPRLQRLSATGAFESMWDSPYPLSVTAAGGGVYAITGQAVRRYDAGGSLLGQWGSLGTLPGQLHFAWGSATDAAGNIYVADSMNDRVQKLDPSGNPLAVIGSAGSGDGQLKGPRDVAVDPAGNVYVADTGNNRVEKFDAAGHFVRAWGGAGSAGGQFAAPSGIAVDPLGNVFVSDTYNHRIERFDGDGHFISKWGEKGAGTGQLFEPFGIAVGESGALWVADSSNHRIVRFCCFTDAPPPHLADPSGTPPEPSSGPAADTVAPHIALTGRRVQRAGSIRRRGLTVQIRSDEFAGLRIAVTISRSSAHRLGLATAVGPRRLTIGRVSTELAAAGGRTLQVKLSARARGALARIGSRRLAVVVRANAADRAGNRTRASLNVGITR